MSAPRLCFPLGGGGGGGGIGGGGTPNRLAMFTAANTISDSAIVQAAGAIQTLGTIVPGTGYASATSVALGGGSGSGATAAITVISSVIVTVSLLNPGSGYTVGDVLTIPGGVGGTVTVTSVVAQEDVSGHITGQRIGAGTNQPTLGIDSRLGGVVTGLFRNVGIVDLGGGNSSQWTTAIASLVTGSFSQTESVNGLGAGGFVRRLRSICRFDGSAIAIDAFNAPANTAVGTAVSSGCFNGTLRRWDSTDLSTNSTLIVYTGQMGAQSVSSAGPLHTFTTTSMTYDSGLVAFNANGTTTTVTGFTFGGSGSAPMTAHAVTDWLNFDARSITLSSGAPLSITNFYGVRLRAQSATGLTITNRWSGIFHEDFLGKSAFYGNLGVGNALDVGAGKVIASLTLTNGGTGYTNGNYSQVALTTVTGTGSGATADIVVAGGIVTTVVLRAPGQGYAVGDTLSCASIGAGSNFLLTVATTASILRSDGTAVASRIGAGTAAPVAAMDAVGGSIVRSSFLYNYNYNSGTNFQIRAHLGIDSSAEPSGATVLASTDSGPAGIVCRPIYDATAITGNIFANGISVLPQISAPSGGTVGITGFAVSPQVNAIGMTGKTVSIIGVSSGGQINNQGAGNSASLTAFSGAVGVFSSTATIAITALTQVTAGGSVSGVAHTVTDFHWYRGTGSTFNNGVVVTNFYGLRLGAPTLAGGATITNRWAINQEDTAAKSLFAGNVGVGIDPGAGKMIASLTLTAGGTLYTNGTYSQVALTGGSGTGATADIVVSGNAVTAVVLRSPGQGYVVGDILSVAAASVGGTGSGFQATVATVASILRSDGQVVAPRIGAGTTTPRAAADVVGGAWLNGFTDAVAPITYSQTTGLLALSRNWVTLRVGTETTDMTPVGTNFAYGVESKPQLSNVTGAYFGMNVQPNVISSSGASVQVSGYAFRHVRSTPNDLGTMNFSTGFNCLHQAFTGAASAASYTYSTVTGFSYGHNFSAAGTTSTLTAFVSQGFVLAAGHVVTTAYGLRLQASTISGGASITNYYPLTQEDTLGANYVRAKTFFGAAVGTAAATTASIEVTAQGTLNGDIRLNSANAVVDVSAASTNGVKFNNRGGAGITSTTQNWYEEGTYTPTFSAAWTPGSFTATWTRIGRKVFITINFAAGTTNGTSGAATITVPVGLTPARPGAGIRARPDGTASGNGVVGVDTAGLIQISTAITLDTNAKVIQCEYEV